MHFARWATISTIVLTAYSYTLLPSPPYGVSKSLTKRANASLAVQVPRAGDFFALAQSSSEDGPPSIDVKWTVPQEVSDRPVYIALVQGNNASNLDLIHVINGMEVKGLQTQRKVGRLTTSQAARRTTARTAGMRHITARVLSRDIVIAYHLAVTIRSRSYSGFFSIVNPDDGGVNTSAVCPDSQLVSPNGPCT